MQDLRPATGKWIDFAAEGLTLKRCPFCRLPCALWGDEFIDFQVRCQHCEYRGPHDVWREAILDHNAVSDAAAWIHLEGKWGNAERKAHRQVSV